MLSPFKLKSYHHLLYMSYHLRSELSKAENRRNQKPNEVERKLAFGGVFPHYKGDSNTTKLTTKQPILAQNDQFNDKTPP